MKPDVVHARMCSTSCSCIAPWKRVLLGLNMREVNEESKRKVNREHGEAWQGQKPLGRRLPKTDLPHGSVLTYVFQSPYQVEDTFNVRIEDWCSNPAEWPKTQRSVYEAERAEGPELASAGACRATEQKILACLPAFVHGEALLTMSISSLTAILCLPKFPGHHSGSGSARTWRL